ncbi:MAG: flagellar basal-body MS-ring/collar protein FliF [Thermodesulfobacteriota bacterium]
MAEEATGKNGFQQFFGIMANMPTARKVSLAVTMLLVVGGFTALLLWTNRPDYQVLFSNLSTTDASRITEKLKEQRIPFQLKEGGSVVLVPDDMVYQLRLDLAGQGLPRGSSVGFEVFDNMSFGTTEFVQRLKYQQALEGELGRTIMQFDTVDQARVHIVTSGDNLFAEPEKPATASVVLRLVPGGVLDPRELQGIVNLVACGVEGLRPENVTVVDMAGGLLSRGQDEITTGGLSRSQLDYQRRLEQSLENRIQTMLEPVVGADNVIARISADVDFRQVNTSEETYDPDSSVVRSEQIQKESSSDGRNLPGGSPDTQYQVADQQPEGFATGSSRGFEKEDSVINYEINRVNRQIINSVGGITRLTAAVIIDGPYASSKGEDGKPVKEFTPRSRREMSAFEEMVKKSIGFDEERGDQISVSNVAFAMQAEDGGRPGFEAQPAWLDYVKKTARPALNLLLIGLFFLLVARPFRNWLKEAGSQQALLPQRPETRRIAVGEGTQGPSNSDQHTQLLEMSKKDPEMAAQIIRSWLSERSG